MEALFNALDVSNTWSWLTGLTDWIFSMSLIGSMGSAGIAALVCLCVSCCAISGIVAFNPFRKP